MVDYIILILKLFLGVLAFIISMGVISSIINLLMVLLFGKSSIPVANVAIAIYSFLFMYLYGFLGGYIYRLYSIYNSILEIKWLVYFICLIAIFAIIKHLINEWNRQQLELQVIKESKQLIESNNTYSRRGLSKILIMRAFERNWVILLSFLVFTFFPEFVELMYLDIPHSLAKLFI